MPDWFLTDEEEKEIIERMKMMKVKGIKKETVEVEIDENDVLDKLIQKFKSTYSKRNYIDLTGKTNLLEFAKVCKNAQLIICNDTSAAHFGALQGTKVFVIANGNRYGRFFPYPKDFQNVGAIFPGSKNFTSPKYYDWEGKMNINMIQVKAAKIALNDFLGN